MNGQARPITEGGMLVAVSAAIALLSMYVPYVNLLWPMPIALLGVRHGMRWGVMTAVCGALAVGVVMSVVQGLFLFLSGGLVGIVLGECLKREMSAGRLLAITTGTALVSNLVLIGAAILVMDIDLIEIDAKMGEAVLAAVTDAAPFLGLEATDTAALEQMSAEFRRMYMMMLPSGLFFYSLFTAVLNFAFLQPIMRRMQMAVPRFSPFESWRMPGWVLYLFVLSLVGTYWGNKWELMMMIAAAENVHMLTSTALLVNGISLLRYTANRNKLLGRLYWFVIVLAIISPFAVISLMVFGGLDILMNYRKNREKRV